MNLLRALRLLLLLCLSVALPVQASASLGGAPPCPMQASAELHADGAGAADDPHDAAPADCCIDADASSDGGPPCKAGADCQTGHTGSLPLPSTASAGPKPQPDAAPVPRAPPR